MIIGAGNCGKTSMANFLNEYEGPLRKTQDTIYGENTIDVPGAYIENSWMYMHTIAVSQDAKCIILMIDQSKCSEIYSPGFAKVFQCPVIGVINKSDLKPENREQCIGQMEKIGIAQPVFHVSMKTGEGLCELKNYISEKYGLVKKVN